MSDNDRTVYVYNMTYNQLVFLHENYGEYLELGPFPPLGEFNAKLHSGLSVKVETERGLRFIDKTLQLRVLYLNAFEKIASKLGITVHIDFLPIGPSEINQRYHLLRIHRDGNCIMRRGCLNECEAASYALHHLFGILKENAATNA